MTKNEFIEHANKIYNGKYIYDKTDLEHLDEMGRVIITCPIHGDFKQTPEKHLHKKYPKGCYRCDGGLPLTMEEFLTRSHDAHGDKYVYSKVDLKHKDEKGRVCIVCPKHGEFWQMPTNHMNGAGCKECWEEKKPFIYLSNKEEFVKKANVKHNFKYTYDKFIYVKSNIEGIITCPIHGDFTCTPNKHLCGHGCKECSKEIVKSNKKIEKNIEKML